MEEVKDKKIVAVAMSGGVDSSVTALLLQKCGYKVVGITGKMIDTESANQVCKNAKKVADMLNIEHYVLDVSQNFSKYVINYFENGYRAGETPNPCIVCNQFIKWGEILDYSIETLHADIFATGHYANVKYENGIYKLYPAKDEHKDQLYFLNRLTQKQLSKTLFPLYTYEKSEIKQMAIDFNLPPKDSKESQDICFIQKPCTTKKYLIDKIGNRKGDFVDIKSGEKLGEHQGSFLYTIGQRKGIGIAAPTPLYVIDIDAVKNIVYVGREEDNYKSSLKIKDVNLSYPIETKTIDAMIKIRYNMRAVKGKVTLLDNNCAQFDFEEPISSVTKGQAGVFYDINDGHLIGGGWVL